MNREQMEQIMKWAFTGGALVGISLGVVVLCVVLPIGWAWTALTRKKP